MARAAGTRYCVVACSVPKEAAQARNAARTGQGPPGQHAPDQDTPGQVALSQRAPVQDAYSSAVFDDLWRRYEEPDLRNRWDSPLFRVAADHGEDSMAPVLQVCPDRGS